ncbi:MAG: RdgB/HAM1 family non-canonical purine NTP pyrophosphatase [Myxococcota bacterium]|nr:RdgB/HAM1 family non-canonical purine NTP pyrophosphatase [Myxococcota bacterium]
MARGRVFAATSNPGKLEEFRSLLAELSIEVLSLAGRPPVTFPEEGTEYEANAIAKARAVAEELGEWALADDSGLEVDALGGAPGPLSARYGGPGLDDSGRVARLLAALEEFPQALERGARFVCVVALVGPGGEQTIARGECSGQILNGVRGDEGFGYDPVFQPQGFDGSMAELGPEVKDQISHRARAFAQLEAALAEIPGASG